MSLKANFHTHTTFCDGHSTAEEMVKTAIEKGFTSLGFSSHSMFPFSSSWHIPVKNFEAYCEEIHRLKTAYKNKINIYLGFEADYIRGFTCPDNPVQSVHYVFYRRVPVPHVINVKIHIVHTEIFQARIDHIFYVLLTGDTRYIQI